METISKLISDLVYYGINTLGLSKEDAVYAKNQLLELFQVEPTDYAGEKKNFQTEILDPLVEFAIENGLAEDGSNVRFETKIMGYVTPSCGLVIKNFEEKNKKEGILAASKYFYDLATNSNYIRLCDIRKNICWYADGDKGQIGITINLSKPEKDAKQVLAEKNFKGNKYPKCLLCLENLGFCGTLTHPARQTLRVLPITLNGENWHVQYSPYVYYDEHCIAFSDEHHPMQITPETFVRLLDFTDLFPQYFLGSNADLPIVGGSILAHEHYQGGKKVLPMFKRPFRKVFYDKDGIKVGIKDWYNSVVTVTGDNKNAVIKMCSEILTVWKKYDDESVDILSHTDDVPHNTVTPIASKSRTTYCVDMILRNNRTDEKHPDGIYHPTADMHNIKKEGIGLIEAMGLFILPGRLKREIMQMIKILNAKQIDFEKLNADTDMNKHLGMIAQIATAKGMEQSAADAQNNIIEYVNATCLKILECTAVFKNTEVGQKAFATFMATALKN